MFDAHCHIQFAEFDECDVVGQARAAGVTGIVAADYDSERRDRLRDLAQYDGVWATCGLHPWALPEDDDAFQAELDAVERALGEDHWVAVGECGLDKSRKGASFEKQKRALARQVGLALEFELPVVLHIVCAEQEVMDILKREARGPLLGMCHGFSGTPEQARAFVDLGMMISVGTNALRGNVGRIREVCRAIPRSRILVETDAPSRPPEGVDGPNHPRYVGRVIEAVADFLDDEPQRIARETEDNARRLFYLDEATL